MSYASSFVKTAIQYKTWNPVTWLLVLFSLLPGGIGGFGLGSPSFGITMAMVFAVPGIALSVPGFAIARRCLHSIGWFLLMMVVWGVTIHFVMNAKDEADQAAAQKAQELADATARTNAALATAAAARAAAAAEEVRLAAQETDRLVGSATQAFAAGDYAGAATAAQMSLGRIPDQHPLRPDLQEIVLASAIMTGSGQPQVVARLRPLSSTQLQALVDDPSTIAPICKDPTADARFKTLVKEALPRFIEDARKRELRQLEASKQAAIEEQRGPVPDIAFGKVTCVKRWLRDNLRDPGSLEIEWMTEPVTTTIAGAPYWAVKAKYRAKNGFGGLNREVKLFYIQRDTVVKTADLTE